LDVQKGKLVKYCRCLLCSFVCTKAKYLKVAWLVI